MHRDADVSWGLHCGSLGITRQNGAECANADNNRQEKAATHEIVPLMTFLS